MLRRGKKLNKMDKMSQESTQESANYDETKADAVEKGKGCEGSEDGQGVKT